MILLLAVFINGLFDSWVCQITSFVQIFLLLVVVDNLWKPTQLKQNIAVWMRNAVRLCTSTFLSLYSCIKHIRLYFHMKWVPNSEMRLTVRCIQYVVCLELHSDRTHMHLKGNALKNDIQSAFAKGMRLTRKPYLWGHSFFKLKGLHWCNAGRREAKGKNIEQNTSQLSKLRTWAGLWTMGWTLMY